MAGALCRKCGGVLDRLLLDQGSEYHIGCEPKEDPVAVVFGNPGGRDPFAEQIRNDLIEVIRWADANSLRSQQQEIGPSEMGQACERFIAYRLAGVPPVNTMVDPWPAIVGTAIHNWLENAINKFQEFAGGVRWSTEVVVHPDKLVRGHMDLFDHWEHMVCDWKSLGPTKMKQWQKSGPPEHQKDQVNLYAKGVQRTGREVRKVCLIGIPRSGWLEDMEVWVDDYRPERAQAALDRMYRIQGVVDLLDVNNHPERFNDIPATPDMCTFCPYFRPAFREGHPADATGCPGK